MTKKKAKEEEMDKATSEMRWGPFKAGKWRWSLGKSLMPSKKGRTDVWYYESKTGRREVHMDIFDGDDKYMGHLTFDMPARKRKAKP